MSFPHTNMPPPSSPSSHMGLLDSFQYENPASDTSISTLPTAPSPPLSVNAPKESRDLSPNLTATTTFTINAPLLQKYLSLETPEEASGLLKQSDDQRDSPGLLANRTAYIKKNYNPKSKFTFYSNPTQFVQGPTLTQLTKALQANELFWLDVYQPNDLDLRLLALIFKIHPLTIEDMMSDDEIREKCEVFDKYLFLCLQTFAQEDQLVESFYYLLLFPKCVLSVRFTPLLHPLNVLVRLTNTPKNKDWAPDWIVYAILDDIMDGFLPVIKALEFDVDCIDDLVLILNSNEQEDMLTRIRGASKKVTQLMRLLHFKDEVVKSFSNRSVAYVQQDTLWYLRDIQDHIVTLHQSLQIAKENLHNAHNIYLSQVNVELSKLSVTSNKIMNRISLQGFLFVPLTFITGLFGMNVNLPGQRVEDNLNDFSAFYGILGGMLIFVAVMIGIAMRYGIY